MKKVIGNRLKTIRKMLDLSQKSFSEYLEINTSTYIQYEQGRRLTPLKTLVKIADKISLNSDYLLGRSNIVLIEDLEQHLKKYKIRVKK